MAKKLITVEKDGEQIQISELTLENHQQLGWMVVEEKGVVAKVIDAIKASAPAAASKNKTVSAPAAKTTVTPVKDKSPEIDGGE